MENSERLRRQARPGIEPDTSRLPVFLKCKAAQPLVGPRTDSCNMHLYPEFEYETSGAAAGSRRMIRRHTIAILIRNGRD